MSPETGTSAPFFPLGRITKVTYQSPAYRYIMEVPGDLTGLYFHGSENLGRSYVRPLLPRVLMAPPGCRR